MFLFLKFIEVYVRYLPRGSEMIAITICQWLHESENLFLQRYNTQVVFS